MIKDGAFTDLFTEKQQEFWSHGHKSFNIKGGAAGVGKTWMDMFLIPQRIMAAKSPPMSKIIIVGTTLTTVKRNIIDPLRDYYGGAISSVGNDGMCTIFGKTVHVFGAEKVSATTKIQGQTVEYAYGDEMTTWNPEFFDMFKTRLRTDGAMMDGTLNPKHPTHWVKEFIDQSVENGSMFYQHYKLEDGRLDIDPVKDRRIKDKLILSMGDPSSVGYRRLINGEWANAEGQVYTKFANNYERHFVNSGDVPKLKKISIGVDFGQSKSRHALVATGISYDNKVYVLASELLDPGMTEDVAGDRYVEFLMMIEYRFGMEVSYTYGDSARTTGILALKNSLRKAGLTRSVWGSLKLNINERISGTNVLINQGRFFYTELAESTRDSLNDAMWDPKANNGEKRLDEDTDILDAFEYSYERDLRALLKVSRSN